MTLIQGSTGVTLFMTLWRQITWRTYFDVIGYDKTYENLKNNLSISLKNNLRKFSETHLRKT